MGRRVRRGCRHLACHGRGSQEYHILHVSRESRGQDPLHGGDAISMGKLDDQGLDLVVGAWLLNYARSEDELVAMFRTISPSLTSEDGMFAGITNPPTRKDDLSAAAEYVNDVVNPKMSQAPWRVSLQYTEPLVNAGVDGGWRIGFKLFGESGEERVKFETYHLLMEAYERAARKGGMHGKFEWREVQLPVAVEGDGENGQALDRYVEDIGAHFGVLVVGKGSAEM